MSCQLAVGVYVVVMSVDLPALALASGVSLFLLCQSNAVLNGILYCISKLF